MIWCLEAEIIITDFINNWDTTVKFLLIRSVNSDQKAIPILMNDSFYQLMLSY